MTAELFGPWHIEGSFDEDTTVSIVDSHHFEVCVVDSFDDAWGIDDIGRARLIAAAPDLLAALKALLDISPFAGDAAGADIHGQAEAAITKAETGGRK